MSPTRDQALAAIRRCAELCTPGHTEQANTPMGWLCNLSLARVRADQFSAGASSGGGGSRPVGTHSDPVVDQAAARRSPTPEVREAHRYDTCDAELEAAVNTVVQAVTLMVGVSCPSWRLNARAVASYLRLGLYCLEHGKCRPRDAAAVIAGCNTLTGLILDVCHTDRSKVGRQASGADCEGCGRYVPGTERDRLRGGLCDKCRKAHERHKAEARQSGTTGLDAATWAAKHLAAMADQQPEVVHVDPKQRGQVVAL